jgi:hypothetical protein
VTYSANNTNIVIMKLSTISQTLLLVPSILAFPLPAGSTSSEISPGSTVQILTRATIYVASQSIPPPLRIRTIFDSIISSVSDLLHPKDKPDPVTPNETGGGDGKPKPPNNQVQTGGGDKKPKPDPLANPHGQQANQQTPNGGDKKDPPKKPVGAGGNQAAAGQQSNKGGKS